jgi:hypothetical protein
MIAGQLHADNIRASFERIHSAMKVVDPEGLAKRRAGLISRRVYDVQNPNQLWHADGNHKLIRWGFVIHGCVDGYSRFIIWMACRTNNKAQTVAELFMEGIMKYGVPSRLRTDRGGENRVMGKMMIWLRGLNRGSFICGRSVHNQRIERMWRDTTNSVTRFVVYWFTYL